MSSGCGDVLSLADLQTAKKHQIFEAEVITGKQGGVAGGADIDYATNQVTGQVQKTMPAILRDIGFEPASFDFTTGGTLTTTDRNKAVLWPLVDGGDGDWYYWEGALPKVIPAASSPLTTGDIAEGAWRPVGDITLRSEITDPEGATLYPELQIARWRDGGDVRGWGAVGDGVTDDTAAIASVTADKIDFGSLTYYVTYLAITQSVIHSDGATLKLTGRNNGIPTALISGNINGILNLVGDTPANLSILSASLSSSGTFPVEYYSGDFRSAKYQIVDLALSSNAPVGSVLLVSADQDGLSGCFEVLSNPTPTTARVLMTAQGTLDLSTFTGTADVLTTVLQFDDVRMLDVSGGVLNLTNIALLGPCFPYANGSRGNFYDPAGTLGGATGIVARGGGTIKGTKTAASGIAATQVSGVDGGTVDFTGCFVSCGGRNGIAASNGKATFGSGVASQNLLDNIISQDVSFVYAVGAKSIQAGRHGGIASNGSSLNITSGVLFQNGFLDPTNGAGLSLSSSVATAINTKANSNSAAGVKAIGNSDARATGLTATGNAIGVSADTMSHILMTGTVSGNTLDASATNSSKIEAIGVSFGTATPAVNKLDGTGALVQTSSTIPNMALSAGINVGSGGLISKIVTGVANALDFPSIAAGGRQSLSVTVPGVLASANTVVLINRRGTTDRAGLMYEAVVSADNTVLITANNFSTAAIDPPSENFNLVIFHF